MLCFYLTSGLCRHFRCDVISAQPRCQVDRVGLDPNSVPVPHFLPHGQACHVTQIRLSDWSKFEILPSDWLVPQPLPYSSDLH